MMEASEINKIYVKSPIDIEYVNMTTLLFDDGKVVSKTKYDISDSYLNLVEPATGDITLFQNIKSVNYFEYNVDLNQNNVLIDGNKKDIFGNRIIGLNNTVIIFVNGEKLYGYEYSIDSDNNTITINHIDKSSKYSSVSICTADDLAYKGVVTTSSLWDQNTKTLRVEDYNTSRYIFFKNGELVSDKAISRDDQEITFTIAINPNVDVLECYRLPSDAVTYNFDFIAGILTYGPEDRAGNPLPEMYDCIVTFNDVTRYLIDNLRKGFMIREENSDGCLVVIDETYETNQLHCIVVKSFINNHRNENQYFIQVPEARSILHYVSNYDLKGVLFRELLSVFQFILLNETYDSLQRLREIRSIDKVDSGNINQLINLLGLKINVTNMTLKQRHNLLEELNNYYNLVGTKASFNFYNTTTTTGNIVNIDQLFTPIRDVVDGENQGAKRYVTFRTAEELGAVYKQEYETPYTSYGDITALANSGETLSNKPRSEGVLQNPDALPNFQPYRRAPIIDDEGETVFKDYPVPLNLYIEKPKMGPNTPTIDYGWINSYNMHVDLSDGNTVVQGDDLFGHLLDGLSDNETVIWVRKDDETEQVNNGGTVVIPTGESYDIVPINTPRGLEYYKRLDKSEYEIESAKILIIKPKFGNAGEKTEVVINTKTPTYDSILDYGNVADPIKGRWVEWFEWDRNPDWYPTNHVEVLTEIPVDIPYEVFSKNFAETFYNIASTVVYIHSLVNTYIFGKKNSNFIQNDIERSDLEYTLLAGPIYNTQEHYLGNDPARQPLPFTYEHPVGYKMSNKTLVMHDGVFTATVEVEVSYNDFTANPRKKTYETFTHDFVCDWSAGDTWTSRELTFYQNTGALREISSIEDIVSENGWSCYMCEKELSSTTELLGNGQVLGTENTKKTNTLRICLPFKEIKFSKPEYGIETTFDDLGFTGEFNDLWSFVNEGSTVDNITSGDKSGRYIARQRFTCSGFGSVSTYLTGIITSGWINITLIPDPSDATVTLLAQEQFTPRDMHPSGVIHGKTSVIGTGTQVIEVPHGLPVKWKVEKTGYYPFEGIVSYEEDTTIGENIPQRLIIKTGTAGTYTLNIEYDGKYELTMCGAGGGGGGSSSKHGWAGDNGGSGAAWKGWIQLAKGTYIFTVGAKGNPGGNSGKHFWGGTAGTESNITYGKQKLIITGGGDGGRGYGDGRRGSGGVLKVNTTKISNVTISTNGAYSSNVSILGNGYGAGGSWYFHQSPTAGTNGYIKLELKEVTN